MAEWPIAAVLKTAEPQGSGGSNPSLSATSRSLENNRIGRLQPVDGLAAEVVQSGGQVGRFQEEEDFPFGGFDEVFFEQDASVAEHHGFAVDGLVFREPTRIVGGAADAQEPGNAEGGVDVLAQAAEVGILAEELGEFAFGRVVLGAEVGG